jgi:hypothetical protein
MRAPTTADILRAASQLRTTTPLTMLGILLLGLVFDVLDRPRHPDHWFGAERTLERGHLEPSLDTVLKVAQQSQLGSSRFLICSYLG